VFSGTLNPTHFTSLVPPGGWGVINLRISRSVLKTCVEKWSESLKNGLGLWLVPGFNTTFLSNGNQDPLILGFSD